MIKNYFKIAYRNIAKYKGFTIINLVGMSLGLTISILILIYAKFELSFDKFHINRDRIFRVTTSFFDSNTGASQGNLETNGWAVGKALKNSYEEIEHIVYNRSAQGLKINHEGLKKEENLQYFGEDFFEIFSFKLLQGDPKTALIEPYSLVITEEMQSNYFSGKNAIGKILTLQDTLTFTVTGIVENVPSNSHIQFDMLVSFSTFERLNPDFTYDEGWGNINVRNYLLLKSGVNQNAFIEKAKNVYTDNAGDLLANWGMKGVAGFEPLEMIYLNSEVGNGLGPIGNGDQVYLVIGVAVFILLLACINFINLSTARSVNRSKEVGIRKVSGSSRNALIIQFLFESFFIVFTSFLISIIAADLSLPIFNEILNKSFALDSLLDYNTLFISFGIVITVTFFSGFYPALVISSTKPTEILRGNFKTGSRGNTLRKILVTFQYLISAALVIATLLVVKQLNFMYESSLGFDKDNIFVLNLADINRSERVKIQETIKNNLEQLPEVKMVSYANAFPGYSGWDGQITHPEGFQEGESIAVHYMTVDPNYANTLGLSLVEGRFFDLNRSTDLDDGLVINETAAYQMGWSPATAIGKKMTSPSKSPEGTVIGVVKDYHQAGLQNKIQPIVLDVRPQFSYLFLIKYQEGSETTLKSNIQKFWNSSLDGYEFDYFYMDEFYNNQYKSEHTLQRTFTVFSLITIIIAVIGLVGLMSFIIHSKSKEIGIRKIHGAKGMNISILLSGQFIWLVLLGNLIAIPIMWFLGEQWLAGFAYRTNLSAELFVITTLGTISVALLTVSIQTFRATKLNPISILKDN